jgi:hypothetical protein
MKKIMITATLIAAALNIVSCNPKELLKPIVYENATISYAYGDTVNFKKSSDSRNFKKFYDNKISKAIVVHDTIALFKGIKLHGQPLNAPDVSKIKNSKDPLLKGKQLEYVAFGSSLTAGMRDGGYYNEGILTAYPELIARQLKLTNFKSPVFESADYNGFGRNLKTKTNPNQGPVQKFAVVTNNTAVVGYDDLEKKPLLKKQNLKFESFNNLAMPGYRISGSPLPSSNEYASLYGSRFNSFPFLGKVLKSKPNFDFFTLEAGSADFMSQAGYEITGFDPRPAEFLRPEDFQLTLLKHAVENGIKGVVLALPNQRFFPAYKQIPCGLIEKNSNNVITNKNCQNGYVFGNSSKLDSIASPLVNINSKTFLYFQRYEDRTTFDIGTNEGGTRSDIDAYNAYRKEWAKQFGFPFLPLDLIYENILAGKYVTDDGVLVNPDWKTGNFFSEDGIFPTAFGHAIIANEILKVMNSYYKTSIPLIPTREYLK